MLQILTEEQKRLILWLFVLGEAQPAACLEQILNTPQTSLLASLQGLEELNLACKEAGSLWQLKANNPSLYSRLALSLQPQAEDKVLYCAWLLATKDGLEGSVALQSLVEKLIDTSRTSGAVACLKLLIHQLSVWAHQGKPESELRQFINLVLAIQSDAFFLGIYMQEANNLSRAARQVAHFLGDIRAQALLDLVGGSLENLSGSYTHASPEELLKNGLKAIASLGDVDIMVQASHFLSMLHYMQGNFKGVFKDFAAAKDVPQVWHCRYFSDMHPLYLCPAAIYLGMYSHALGIALSALRTAEIRKEPFAVLWWHTLLGVIFLQLELPDKALEHINEVINYADAPSNPKMYLWVWRALALFHAQQGRWEISWQIMKNCLSTLAMQGLKRFSFTAPWIIDLFAAYEQHGFAPIEQFILDEEIENILKSPNEHLQAAVYRIQAQGRGVQPNLQTKAQLLQKSCSLFYSSGNVYEWSKSAILLASVLEEQGLLAEAKQLQHKAEKFKQRFCRALQSPVDKQEKLVWQGFLVKGQERSWSHCLQIISNLEAATTLNRAFALLTTTVQRELGAERAWLVEEDDSLQYICGSNFSQDEFQAADFQKHFQNLRSFQAKHKHKHCVYVSETQLALILNLPISPKRHLSMYLESSYFAGVFAQLSQADLERLGRVLIRELRIANKIETARRDETKAVQERSQASQVQNKMRYDQGSILKRTVEQALSAATSEASILLLGETGVGKEVMAKRIHECSGRKGAFVPVHPTSTPESLFESEFFGHEKGAFTGAVRQKIGLFELAHQGTFFIDEVGDIPMFFQTKLLRVLQDRSFMRIGGTRTITSEFRLITATNRNLWEQVQAGTFREDLFYRISVIPFTLPPLRERRADIEDLVTLFIEDFSRRYGKKFPPLEANTLQMLKDYAWPGNIRELKNVVERSVILNTGEPLVFVLGQQAASSSKQLALETLHQDLPTLEELNKRYIQHVLNLTQGKIMGNSGAEVILGMKRSTLYARIKQYGLKIK